jgi:hypothetical protein
MSERSQDILTAGCCTCLLGSNAFGKHVRDSLDIEKYAASDGSTHAGGAGTRSIVAAESS